jgi:hypothetical protein
MSWWTSANVEPKRKSRFIVEIANGFFLPNVKTCSKPSANVDLKEFQLINHKFKYPGVVTWGDIKITMIDMNGNSVKQEFRNLTNEYFVASSPTKVTTVDQSLDTALLLWRMLKHTGYNLPTEAVGPIAALGPNRQLTTTEKASSIANGFGRGLYGKADTSLAGVNSPSSNAQSVRIYTLDPDGNTVETWTLHNPQIKTVNWGDHAYDSDEFVEYSLDISYDFAHLEKGRKVTVGPGLFDTPEINTPVSIQTKYNEFIAVLQSGKAFEEARVAKARDIRDSIQGTLKESQMARSGLQTPEDFLQAEKEKRANDYGSISYSTYTPGQSFQLGEINYQSLNADIPYQNVDGELQTGFQAGGFGADMDASIYSGTESGDSINLGTIIQKKNKQ